MTGFASRPAHIFSTRALASASLGASSCTEKNFDALTSETWLKPRSSRAFLVFFPSGSATPFLSFILISATNI